MAVTLIDPGRRIFLEIWLIMAQTGVRVHSKNQQIMRRLAPF